MLQTLGEAGVFCYAFAERSVGLGDNAGVEKWKDVRDYGTIEGTLRLIRSQMFLDCKKRAWARSHQELNRCIDRSLDSL